MTNENQRPNIVRATWETFLLVLLFFSVAGNSPPGINEAHYLVKAKHFWDPTWLADDVFASSRNAHTAFFATIGALTQWFDLTITAWIGRLVGWTLLAAGLYHFCWQLFRTRYAALAVAVIWIVGVERANLAGEWVVGGIESKVLAYGFVLFGLGQMIKGRWSSVWVLLGTAAAFHVLVGGWSVVIAFLVRFTARQANVARLPDISEWLCLLLGGAISLFGLLPSLALSSDANPENVDIASHLYAFGRIRHHLTPSSFPIQWFLRHGALILFTAATSHVFYYRLDDSERERFKPFYIFAAGAFLLAIVGCVLGILPSLNPTLAAKLLRFYWFRMTDAFVPLAAAVTITGLAITGLPIKASNKGQPKLFRSRLLQILSWGAIIACILVMTSGFLKSVNRGVPASIQPTLHVLTQNGGPSDRWDAEKVYEDWLAVSRWARESTPEDATFITPRHQQTFKWYAHRSEVVNWKDVPQDANSLIEWAKRFNRIFPQINSRRHPPLNIEELREIANTYGVEYIIIDRRVINKTLPLPQAYPANKSEDSVFVAYAFPPS